MGSTVDSRDSRTPSGDRRVIADAAALAEWSGELRRAGGTRRLADVDFRLPWIPEPRNRTLTALARGYGRACGCASAGLCLTLAVLAILAWCLASGRPLAGIGWPAVALYAAIAAGAALLGKALGLAWARLRLMNLARQAGRALPRPAQQPDAG